MTPLVLCNVLTVTTCKANSLHQTEEHVVKTLSIDCDKIGL